jgi:DNA polymerase III alpha subunit
VVGERAPFLPGMTPVETAAADLWATGVTLDGYPTTLVRAQLNELGVVTSAGLRTVENGRRIWVGGVVTHRQRPATAGGTTFINLEDETGLINIICSKGVWAKYRSVARGASGLLVRGICERMEMTALKVSGTDGSGGPAATTYATTHATTHVINIIADRLEPLWLSVQPGRSRDFH